MRNHRRAESPSFLDRVVGAVGGSVAGILFYAGLVIFPISSPSDPEQWSLSGDVKWYILGGLIFGITGGAHVAKALLFDAFDSLRSDAASTSATWMGFILFIVAIFVAMKYFAS